LITGSQTFWIEYCYGQKPVLKYSVSIAIHNHYLSLKVKLNLNILNPISQPNLVRLLLVGFGVVGQSLVKLLLSRSTDLYKLYGVNPRVVACIDSHGSAVSTAGLDLQRLLEAKRLLGSVGGYDRSKPNYELPSLIEKADAEIVIELTPTNIDSGEPGISNIVASLKSGKHVITVNKGPLALAFPSLLELANYNDVKLRFSGTVGGGTPILEFAKRSLKGDNILSFRGILNGTTNYILSKMEQGLEFNDAFNDAKLNGYAEASSLLDIDGFDAAAKLVIMANWIMGMKVTIKDVYRRGIGDINLTDVKRANKAGKAIKLIGKCENRRLCVEPTELSNTDPICVNGTLNAVTFCSQHSGDHTIIGQGAGGSPTASAVLRDLIDIRTALLL
jgi:homoserine dehydrogenase